MLLPLCVGGAGHGEKYREKQNPLRSLPSLFSTKIIEQIKTNIKVPDCA